MPRSKVWVVCEPGTAPRDIHTRAAKRFYRVRSRSENPNYPKRLRTRCDKPKGNGKALRPEEVTFDHRFAPYITSWLDQAKDQSEECYTYTAFYHHFQEWPEMDRVGGEPTEPRSLPSEFMARWSDRMKLFDASRLKGPPARHDPKHTKFARAIDIQKYFEDVPDIVNQAYIDESSNDSWIDNLEETSITSVSRKQLKHASKESVPPDYNQGREAVPELPGGECNSYDQDDHIEVYDNDWVDEDNECCEEVELDIWVDAGRSDDESYQEGQVDVWVEAGQPDDLWA